MKQFYVYIAGPISKDSLGGTRNAIEAATRILQRGHFPFIPHLTCFWDLLQPAPYETWMEYDFGWIRRCDALVRLDGVSPGSDRDVALAVELGKPVFFGLDEFMRSPLWASSEAEWREVGR